MVTWQYRKRVGCLRGVQRHEQKQAAYIQMDGNVYSRLSRDDELSGESNSVTNQKTMLESYAKAHGFTDCVHYCDDGYSGTNFQRLDWMRLMLKLLPSTRIAGGFFFASLNTLKCILKK